MTVKKIEEKLGAEIDIAEYIGEPCVENISLKLLKNIRDLINSQQAEIEKLKIENQSLRGAANSYKLHYSKIRAEAVKEFAELLKDDWWHNAYYSEDINVRDWIDKLLKEMAGDTE